MFPWVFRLNAAGWAHLWFFIALPLAVIARRKKVVGASGPLPNRLRHFRTTAFEIAVFAAVSLAVARAERMSLFPSVAVSLGAALAGLAVLTAQLGYMWPRWRRAVEMRSRLVHLFMPSNATERLWWLVVAVCAGVGEEITWRGVQWALLANLTGNYLVAALLCSVLFGAAHMTQGWRSSLVIVGFALSFHLLAWLAGSLYVAMAVHVTYDVIAGLTYGRLGRALGYAAQTTPA